MTRWAEPPLKRDQLVLFSRKLDEEIPANHLVRFLDEILGQMDWRPWESSYHLTLGQPAIHPRVLAGVVIYGLMQQVRSSYRLEEQLHVRIDFRWLAEDRRIDHSTICKFRQSNTDKLKQLFVQVNLLARNERKLPLERVGFDGTRIQANNRRSGTRTREQLQRELAELEAEAKEQFARAEAEDAAESQRVPLELPGDLTHRKERIQAALDEYQKLTDAGGTVPARLPITDPEARVMPNKTGGCGVNYTPTAAIDMESGLILEADVLNVTNEDQQLVPALEAVQRDYGLSKPPDGVADGLMATGANLHECEQRGITLYSPVPLPDPENPALRPDLAQPVPEADWDRLPTSTIRNGDQKTTQLDKSAFVFEAAANRYWCPMGQPLEYKHTTTEKSGTGRRIRDRYQADPVACAACPLAGKCLSGQAKSRSITREQYEAARERQARRMAQPEAIEIYRDRRHAVETPFAVIKHRFGLRQFLTRGLDRVKQEWQWACLAFNLRRIASWRMLRATSPPPAPATVP